MTRHALQSTTAGLLALCAVLGAALGSGVVLGAATPTIGIDGPDAVDDGSTTQATLQATGVTDPDGVGAYEIEITYDPAVVSVSASASGSFSVETSSPSPGVLRIVGYTDSLPGPDGTVTLAALDVTGEAPGTATLDITVEEFADADANDLAYTTTSATISVAGDGSSPTTTTSAGSGGGTGGTQTTDSPPASPVTEETRDLVDANPGANGTTIRFESVSVTEITFDGEVTGGTVQIRDHGSSLPDSVRSAAGSENVVHAIEITVPAEYEDSPATFRLSIPADALGDTAPSDARVARFVDGSWEFLPTRVVSTDGPIILEVQTPGFSVFGVFADQRTTTTTASNTEDTGTDDSTTDTEDTTTSTADGTTTPTDEPGDGGGEGGVGFTGVVLAILVLTGVAAGIYWFRRGESGE